MGRTARSGGQPFSLLPDGREEGTVSGAVMGTYLHGLFDAGEVTDQLARWLLERKGLPPDAPPAEDHLTYQERQLDELARLVRANLDLEAVYRVMEEFCHG